MNAKQYKVIKSKKLKVTMAQEGPVMLHNLYCWFCEENPAIYSMNDGIFKPCWKCQKDFKGYEHKHMVQKIADAIMSIKPGTHGGFSFKK